MSERYVGGGTQAMRHNATPYVCVRAQGHLWVSERSSDIQEHCLGSHSSRCGWSPYSKQQAREGSHGGDVFMVAQGAWFVCGWDLLLLCEVRMVEGSCPIFSCFPRHFYFAK